VPDPNGTGYLNVGPFGGAAISMTLTPGTPPTAWAIVEPANRLRPARVYRSTDGGRHFEQVDAPRIEWIKAHPSNPDVLYARIGFGNLVQSRDGGATFAPFGPAHDPPRILVVRPDGSEVFAASATSLYRSRDDGATWSAGSPFPGAASLYIADGVLFATGDKLWRSEDDGRTFSAASVSARGPDEVRPGASAIAHHPAQPGLVVAVFGAQIGLKF